MSSGLDIEELLESTRREQAEKEAQKQAQERQENERGRELRDAELTKRNGSSIDDEEDNLSRRSGRGGHSSRRYHDYHDDDRYNDHRYDDRRPPRTRSRSPRGDNFRPRHDDRRSDRHSYRDRGSRYYEDDRYHSTRRRHSPEPAAPRSRLTDDERDRRTVFVQQLAGRTRNKDLERFFSQAGEVAEASVVKDKVTGRSKGVGYVEFKSEESVPKAIQMTGQKLLEIPIIVQVTEAEKNRLAKAEGSHNGNANGIPVHRLYVGNIHFNVSEQDLEAVFAPFGELESVALQREEGGRSKGYGFVQFSNPENAKEALDKMNGFELAGRNMRVGLGNDKFTPESTQNFLRSNSAAFTGSQFSGAGGKGNYNRAAREKDKVSGASALDDSDVAGVNFNSYSRDALMRKLARTDENPSVQVAAKPEVKKAGPVEGFRPSRCIKIENVFDRTAKHDADFFKEIEDDIRYEANKKYGEVVHFSIDRNSDIGEVFLKFKDAQGGLKALQALQGRSFDGRILSARPVVDAVYHSIYPKSQNL